MEVFFLYLLGRLFLNTDWKGLGKSLKCFSDAFTDSTNPDGSCSGDVDKYCEMRETKKKGGWGGGIMIPRKAKYYPLYCVVCKIILDLSVFLE